MAKARYKQIFEETWKENEQLFKRFFLLNNEYTNKRKRRKIEDEFQTVGTKVKELLQHDENELCRQMEKSNHRVFSSNLADKYWDEVRKYFKYIDFVGVVSR
jgi:uncharacterized membrane protein YgaE (UPF0421/DUF939 family)